MIVLSQHRVLSLKFLRPRAPCGARSMGHAIWSAVCSGAPHSPFGEGARPIGRMELPNTSPQAIEPNPSCWGQGHSNRPDIG